MPAHRIPRPTTRLRVARLIGASAVALLGQFAVDMPQGYFGGRDVVTAIGWAFSAIVLLGTLIEAIGQFRGRGRPSLLTPLVLSASLAVFVPAIAADPLIAGPVALWQGVTLARHYLDRAQIGETRALRGPFDSDAPVVRWLARHGAATTHLLVVSLACWIAVVGYERTGHWIARVILAALFAIALVPSTQLLVRIVRHSSRVTAVIWAPLVAIIPFAADPEIVLSLVALHLALALLVVLRRSPTVQELVLHFHARPALFVVSTFGAAIAVGAVALTFPACSASQTPLAPVDALFTSTSAVCVTGLIVLDTPIDLSLVGQVVLLVLIQAGGLGIMVLSSFATVLLAGRLPIRTQHALGRALDAASGATAQRLALFIVTATLAIEALGAAALYPAFASAGHAPARAAWLAVFHSVSAFCNAGFSLQSDSVVMFQREPLTLFVFAALITAGGLGFSVLAAGWGRMWRRDRGRLPVHVRVVGWATLGLFLFGALAYAALEWNQSLGGLAAGDKLANAAFQSVTLRTAGFNSVAMEQVRSPTSVLMIVLMLVGASPGGTGGGMKTTTIVVLLAVIPAIARGESRVTLFGRSIPQAIVYRAAAIAAITVCVFTTGTMALAVAQDLPLDLLLFESASAVGTVGLSLGATAKLAPAGKYLVIALMFVGRVGPLTLALSLGRGEPRRGRHPEEAVAVG